MQDILLSLFTPQSSGTPLLKNGLLDAGAGSGGDLFANLLGNDAIPSQANGLLGLLNFQATNLISKPQDLDAYLTENKDPKAAALDALLAATEKDKTQENPLAALLAILPQPQIQANLTGDDDNAQAQIDALIAASNGKAQYSEVLNQLLVPKLKKSLEAALNNPAALADKPEALQTLNEIVQLIRNNPSGVSQAQLEQLTQKLQLQAGSTLAAQPAVNTNPNAQDVSANITSTATLKTSVAQTPPARPQAIKSAAQQLVNAQTTNAASEAPAISEDVKSSQQLRATNAYNKNASNEEAPEETFTVTRETKESNTLFNTAAIHTKDHTAKIEHKTEFTTHVSPARQIAEEVALQVKSLNSGTKIVQIQLIPHELGRVEVEMKMHEGIVQVKMTVDRPETLHALQADGKQLETALRDVGFKANAEGMSFNLRDQSKEGQQQTNQHNNQHQQHGYQAETPVIAAESSARTYFSNRALDIAI